MIQYFDYSPAPGFNKILSCRGQAQAVQHLPSQQSLGSTQGIVRLGGDCSAQVCGGLCSNLELHYRLYYECTPGSGMPQVQPRQGPVQPAGRAACSRTSHGEAQQTVASTALASSDKHNWQQQCQPNDNMSCNLQHVTINRTAPTPHTTAPSNNRTLPSSTPSSWCKQDSIRHASTIKSGKPFLRGTTRHNKLSTVTTCNSHRLCGICRLHKMPPSQRDRQEEGRGIHYTGHEAMHHRRSAHGLHRDTTAK